MSDPDEELAALVKKVRARDPAAEAALHGRYRRFVERRLAEARERRNWFWLDDQEDAVQETFVSFFAAVRDGRFAFEGESRLKGFLVRTAWFVAMNAKDKAPKTRTVSLSVGPDDEANTIDVPSFVASASDRLARRECTERLYAAIQSLADSRRDVVLRTLAGEKVREIVKATGKTAAAISGLKFNAFKELKVKLEENGFVRDCGADTFSVAAEDAS